MTQTRRTFLKGLMVACAAAVAPLPKLALKGVSRVACSTGLTLFELVRRNRNDHIAQIVECLNETNEILKDAVWEQVDK